MTAPHPYSRRAAVPAPLHSVFAAFRKPVLPVLMVSVIGLSACATNKPPEISYDDPQPAVLLAEPPASVQVVELPKPLPLPGQLKPVEPSRRTPEPTDPTARVNRANAAARVQPVRDGFINAVQVYPFSSGALYQVYTAPGQITDIRSEEHTSELQSQ